VAGGREFVPIEGLKPGVISGTWLPKCREKLHFSRSVATAAHSVDLRVMPNIESDQVRDTRANCIHWLLWLLWQAVRWPVLMLLIVLEPLIRIALCGFSLLGTLTAVMIRYGADRPAFPFWVTLGFSLSSVGGLVIYYAIIRALSRQ
jgi:hypothetical protein